MSPAVRYAISRLPAAPGVYRFRGADGAALYIGRATSLRSRVGSYWSDLRDREHLAPMVAAVGRVEAVACASVLEAAWLERNLLEAGQPAWNRTAGGQEVEVFIGLTATGLSVSHRRQGPCSGPYLGGLRARQAVRGLRRILPSDAEAKVRGGTGHQERISRLEAILGGDPQAARWARTGLERMRDRASEVLAFELAARIQEEITALAWITSPQRVTTDAGEVEAHGWHGGVTVRFGFRDGRLREWTQQAGTDPPPARQTGTPPELHTKTVRARLAEFAQDTAELAAAMLPPAPYQASGRSSASSLPTFSKRTEP
jgi:excinuclease ABC subunit C